MPALPRIQVSANRRDLVSADGQPFFWLGDTAWELFHRLTRAESELYLENRRPIEVDLGRLSGAAARAWWFDPRSGTAAPTGDCESGGWQAFTPPAGGPDWVLVVDDAARGFGAPGAA